MHICLLCDPPETSGVTELYLRREQSRGIEVTADGRFGTIDGGAHQRQDVSHRN